MMQNYDDTMRQGEMQSGLDLTTFTSFFREIEEQPSWRAKADKEADYYDGNQLDSEVLRKQQEIGMPPAIEPLIGPTIDAVLGMEAKTRTDWRVQPDGDKTGDQVAKALNYKLNQTERQSKADAACSDAYKSQISVGIGWVEVARSSDPFEFPYCCSSIPRNEIWWDWLDLTPDLKKARYLVRRKWTDRNQAKLMFPNCAELIEHAGGGWCGIDLGNISMDGGTSTDLAMAWGMERGWSVEEQQWRDINNRRVCLFEVWYRDWQRVLVLKIPDGRVVEYDTNNEMHQQVLAMGAIKPQYAVVSKMRLSYWMGPHRLHDGPTPYRHNKFPYVPFWGKREDRTGVPYGLIRGMMYLQDNVNASTSKIRWGLSAVRTTRTDGAVADDDETFRQEIARPDADIVLNAEHMSKAGAVFKVERDFQLSQQQYQMLVDAREGIKRTGGITDGLMGSKGTATSGLQESTQIEQSTQALADINDNFKTGRANVGDLLLSLLIEDMIEQQIDVTIDGGTIKDDEVISLNVPKLDEDTGIQYLENDIARTKLKVALNDVPSTPSFRSQQLNAMSEAFKSMPPQYQAIALPHLLSLMDIPNRDEIITAIREASQQASPEQIQEQIDAAVKQALSQSGMELKMKELDLKYNPQMIEAQAQKMAAEATKIGVEAAYAAMQAAGAIVATPQIAPVADVVMQLAGYRPPNPAGVDPNYPQPAGIVPAVEAAPEVQQNTSPALPPVPQSPASPMDGIETARMTDNQEGALP